MSPRASLRANKRVASLGIVPIVQLALVVSRTIRIVWYEKSRRVWNMKCGGMRASTLGCRFLDRCGDSLGVESSFKDICILPLYNVSYD